MRVPAPRRHGDVGDSFAKAFELVVTPAVFGLVGWAIDRSADTTPLFTIVFAVLALVGKVAAEWYRYQYSMDQIEQDRVEGRNNRRVELSTSIAEPDGRLAPGVRLDGAAEAGTRGRSEAAS